MINLTLPISISYLQNSGYLIIFLLMFFEGAIVTYVTSFLASQGILNVYIILLLSIFGNVIPDTILFLLGKHSRTNRIKKISKFFGLTPLRIEKLEEGFSNHAGKSIVLLKLIPGLAIPGLILAGFSKVSFRKFFTASTIFNVSSALLFTSLGFSSGITVSSFLKYLNLEKYILIVLVIFSVIIYVIIKFLNKKLRGNLR